MATLNITMQGKLFESGTRNYFIEKMTKAVTEITNVVMKEAIDDYKKKKIAKPVLPSLIVQSFYTTNPTEIGNSIKKTIFCGAPMAPWLKYVNDGHAYSNGTIFFGHHFIEAALKKGTEVAIPVINKYLNSMR